MKRDALRRVHVILCMAVLMVAGAAHAVDGVLEINNASIIAAGGYPYTIPAPGSYVLTGNLTPPPAVGALVLGAPNVEIDLNGFTITSPGGGAANGIDSAGNAGLTARRGVVQGFGGTGILGAGNAKILQMRITGNGSGITGGFGCVIVESVIDANTSVGIAANNCKIENTIVQTSGVGIFGGANVIVHNRIFGNAGGGILILGMGGGTIQENMITDNAAFGISDTLGGPPPVPPPPGPPPRTDIRGNTINASLAGPGISTMLPALIADNSVSGSFGSGVVCGAACTVRGNTVESNNLGLLPGSGGVIVAAGSSVTNNSISFNNGFGLTLPLTAGYSQNVLNANGPPDVISGGPHPTSGFQNLCTGIPGPNPFCP